MTKAMPFLQKYDITFLRPPTISPAVFLLSIHPKGLQGEMPLFTLLSFGSRFKVQGSRGGFAAFFRGWYSRIAAFPSRECY